MKASDRHYSRVSRDVKAVDRKEKRAETSFEVRPLFRAYDRRELGLPNRALSRLESIRLVDASTESKSCAMAIEPRPID
jgi:hypothetical protein